MIIKYVKKANSYCVTYFNVTAKKVTQLQKWFRTREKAEAFRG